MNVIIECGLIVHRYKQVELRLRRAFTYISTNLPANGKCLLLEQSIAGGERPWTRKFSFNGLVNSQPFKFSQADIRFIDNCRRWSGVSDISACETDLTA
jgi:hypothetical protein